MISLNDNNSISCHEFQLLISEYMENDPGLTAKDRQAFEAHREICSSCSKEYEEDKWLIALCKKYWGPISKSTRRLLEENGYSVKEPVAVRGRRTRPMTVQESWEDLKRRSPSLATACHRQEEKDKHRRLYLRIGVAVAASIVVAIGFGWLSCKGQRNTPQIPIAVNAPAKASILENATAEFITPQGKTPLQLNQQIKAGDSPQEILLGGMHRVVMNANVVATFTAEPVYIETEHRARYAIQLSKGEIYVEVVPGHPFSVRTHNALLKITGTKFNVTADSDETKLTLLKGSVRFSNLSDADEFVDVTAGYRSLIKGQFLPTRPVHSNALTATAWARDFIMGNALAQVQPGLDEDFLESIRNSWIQTTPPDLDKIDYVQWREEHRDWFKKQFPWIFEIQMFLSEQRNIEADYIDLLMASGDIWQFNYPRSLGKPIAIYNPCLINRIATYYNVAFEQFESLADCKNLPSVKPTEMYRGSLANWHSAIVNAGQNQEGDIPDELLLFNLKAGQYLSNTRTAAYLWIKENPEKAKQLISDKNYCEFFLTDEIADSIVSNDFLLTYLTDQVSNVSAISNGSQELFITPKSSGCEDNIAKLVRELQDGLSEFMHGGFEK